jgi:hypothetical protein
MSNLRFEKGVSFSSVALRGKAGKCRFKNWELSAIWLSVWNKVLPRRDTSFVRRLPPIFDQVMLLLGTCNLGKVSWVLFL